ncbi:MAG TPA: SUF system Fe-S cluster assembly protein [Chitinophagales bacterium]|nr:SUF system Fe-S cluster assembly protein [Chitinophagales bacterium]
MRNFMEIKDEAITVIQDIYDPEIPVNIYDLGLIYEVNVDPSNNIHVLMTLTSPSCPVAESLPGEVKTKLKEIDGANEVEVELTFDPPWTTELMTEAAKLELGML